MSDELDDYLDHGMIDNIERPHLFVDLMRDRKLTLCEYYLAGITQLESWYGDKAYKNYEAWFEVLDFLLIPAENHFIGRFGNQ